MGEIQGDKEVRYWQKHYSNAQKGKFAVVKVGGGVIMHEHHLKALCESLTFLHHVGLHPIVLHGAGPQLNAELEQRGIVSDYILGERITTPEIFKVARMVFSRENRKLVKALNEYGSNARSVAGSEVFRCVPKSAEYGMVGEITDVFLDPINAWLDIDQIPVLYSLGETETGQLLNINADIAAMQLARAVQPLKVVLINEGGGLRNNEGELLNRIDFPDMYDHLIQQPWVRHGLGLKLREIKKLLDVLPHHASVSVTGPGTLAKELFTHKGKGTLCRKQALIQVHTSLDSLDLTRLKELIEKSFCKALLPGYFDSIRRSVTKIYISDDYTGATILTKHDDVGDAVYMDKFAVTEEAQGSGVAGRMWELVKSENPKLFWRSKGNNKINNWYFSVCDGAQKLEDRRWVSYWIGLESTDEINACVSKTQSLPISFDEIKA